MNDFPKLCAELIEDVSYLLRCVDDGDIDPVCIAECRQDLARARAARSEPLPPPVCHVLRLAQIIREVNGNHDKMSTELAEAILSHPGIAEVPALSGPLVGAAAASDEEWEARFRSWWSDHQGGAYFDAVPLVACIEWTRYAIAHFGATPQPANGKSPTAGELQTMAKMFGLEVNDWGVLSWLVVTCIAAYGDGTTPTPIPVAERLPREGV